MSINHCLNEWSFPDKMTNVFCVQLKRGNRCPLHVSNNHIECKSTSLCAG